MLVNQLYTICAYSVLGNCWKAAKPSYELIESIRSAHNISYLCACAIAGRNIKLENIEHFLNPSLKNAWISPKKLPDIKAGIEKLKTAIENNSKIGIIGDYDVDGICASVLWKDLLDELNIQTVVWLPNRNDNYGPSKATLEFFKQNPVNLLLMVDCGSNAHEFIKSAANEGFEMIIIDHHITDFNTTEFSTTDFTTPDFKTINGTDSKKDLANSYSEISSAISSAISNKKTSTFTNSNMHEANAIKDAQNSDIANSDITKYNAQISNIEPITTTSNSNIINNANATHLTFNVSYSYLANFEKGNILGSNLSSNLANANNLDSETSISSEKNINTAANGLANTNSSASLDSKPFDSFKNYEAKRPIIINPHRSDTNKLEQGDLLSLCATGISFLVAHQLLKALNIDKKISQSILKKLLDLVALATICDIMPMTHINRALISQGLKILEEQSRVGIKIMLQQSKIKFPLTCNDVGFFLGPRLNAAGRIKHSSTAFDLLSTVSDNTALTLVKELEKLNQERKIIQEYAFQEACQLLEKEQFEEACQLLEKEQFEESLIQQEKSLNLAFDKNDKPNNNTQNTVISETQQIRFTSEKPLQNFSFETRATQPTTSTAPIICLYNQNWSPGIIGIVAAMLQEKFGKPAIIGSLQGNTIKASARSKFIHIGNLIQRAALEKLIIAGGGHQFAGGLSCTLEQWEIFTTWIQKQVESTETIQNNIIIDAISDIIQIKDEHKKLAPHGPNHEELIILSKDVYIQNFFETEKSTRISILQNFESHTFFLQKKQKTLIENIKKAHNEGRKLDILIKLNEKGYHNIIDINYC